MSLLRNWITNNDYFGYYVRLNINNKSDAHKTLCGGTISLIVNILFVLFLYLRLEVVWTGAGDENTSQDYLIGDEER